MSTNATIAILHKDGTVDMTTCHCDGYLIGGVGETLINHYKDAESVKDLISGGYLSQLGATKNASEFYKTNEGRAHFQSYASYEKTNKESYNYIFNEKNGAWTYSNEYENDGGLMMPSLTKRFKPLTKEVIISAREQIIYDTIRKRDSNQNVVNRRKDIIEDCLIKGADFENVKKRITPAELSKQVNRYAQEKFDHAQSVADKINLKKRLDNILEAPTKQPAPTFEEMMSQLGKDHKAKQEQSLTKDGRCKI
ncbi:hypothetical protein [Burkholderia cenocepacia]|uniref:hypothetical protein n=1 Tax=Burkholderia cenocepacia TaxID=95486 RepID=UPI002ABD7F1D|nr:hypothetical protein [Burkholderia cenocepacia]